MISITTLIIAPLTLILLLLSFYALTTATSVFNRIIITTLLIAGMGISFVSFNTLLSLPKTTSMEWVYRNIEEAEIIYGDIQRGEALYLWIRIPDVEEPRYYVMDWDEELAKKLQEALTGKENSKRKGRIIIKHPFNQDFSLEDRKSEIKFVPIPKQLPDKPYEVE